MRILRGFRYFRGAPKLSSNMKTGMKIKVLTRNPADYKRETVSDIHKLPRNYDPDAHHFSKEREYVKALNSVKLERVFAKPFIGCFGEEDDLLKCLELHRRSLSVALSGTFGGKLSIWNIPKRRRVMSIQSHSGQVDGICVHPKEDSFFTVGADSQLKQWSLNLENRREMDIPKQTVLLQAPPCCIDHHWTSNVHAVGLSDAVVQLYDDNAADPIQTWRWGNDAVTGLRFNPVETSIFTCLLRDKCLVLYDVRQSEPLRKMKMELRSNAVAWNPIEAFNFTLACEDYNLHTFDIRDLSKPTRVHRGHTRAVMDVSYSPTGQEFVSASTDGTLALWPVGKTAARDVYHTKRMKRVYCARYSLDAHYIVSASWDFNLRLWKARASEKLGPLRPREKAALDEAERLKEEYKDFPMIKRISHYRHVPKRLFEERREIKAIRSKQRRKEKNMKLHAKDLETPMEKETEKHVVAEIE